MADYANILLFLAHLTRDPFLIEELIAVANGAFADQGRASIESDVAFLGDLTQAADRIVLDDRHYLENRHAEAVAKDTAELAIGPEPQELPEDDILSRVNIAFKSLQILGQLLKNFPNSLPASTKSPILDACYGIGLRTLSFGFNLLRAENLQLVQAIAEIIQKHHPELGTDAVRVRAQRTVLSLARSFAFGLVKYTSSCVGSADLSATYDDALQRSPETGTYFVHTSIMLDRMVAPFPFSAIEDLHVRVKGNPFGEWLSQALVHQHFLMFPQSFQTKQKACKIVGIEYKALQADDPKRLLLSRSTKK